MNAEFHFNSQDLINEVEVDGLIYYQVSREVGGGPVPSGGEIGLEIPESPPLCRSFAPFLSKGR